MRTMQMTFWRDGEFYVGYLNDYPDYRTQGSSKEELVENLRGLLKDIWSGIIQKYDSRGVPEEGKTS